MDELIKRSEESERAAWRDLYRQAPRQVRRGLGLESVERHGATFLSASQVDHLLLNRVIGLGSSTPTSQKTVAATARYFEERGIERYWIHLGSNLRYSGLPARLREQGIVPYPRSWMKFVRRITPVEQRATDIAVRPATRADAHAIGEILAGGFDLPVEVGPLLAAGIDLRGWQYFVAEDSHRVVAASGLFTRAGDAHLAFAATRPEARRRGCQRALMAARLRDAERLGCRYAFTETGLPVSGEPNSSYRNMMRIGFDELYVRDNFAPEGTKWLRHPSSDAIAKSVGSRAPSRTLAKAAARPGS